VRRRARSVPGGLGVAVAVAALATGCSASGPTPEEVAASMGPAVDDYLADVDPEGQVRALLVHHDGELVLERYVDSTADDYWDTQSVTKSVMATLVGIAIEEGHIEGVEETVGDLLPSRAAEMTDDTAAVTLHQVLTHTGGFASTSGSTQGEYFFAEDWVGQILADRNDAGADDGSFAYSNAGAHLLAAILVEATGVPVLDYARDTLFDPLGIPHEPAFEPAFDFSDEATVTELYGRYRDAAFTWPVDPQDIHEGACCVKLRTQDLAAIGQLYLDGGRVGDEQVVPQEWVEQATTPHVEVNEAAVSGYGYMWWTTDVAGEPGFVAYGSGGQVIQVVPGHDLVVTVATEFDPLDPSRLSTQLGRESAANLVELAVVPHLSP
jgi:CubicO group peptidase (beta-lactamase class C family)